MITALISLGVLAPALCHAAGGAYFDNILCRSDGAVAGNYTFDTGLQGWQLATDALITPPGNPFPSPSLYLNCHGRTRAGASCRVNATDPRVVELHAWIYMPKVAEQGDYSSKVISFAYMGIWPKTQSCNIYCGPQLRPKEDGYRIAVLWNNGQGRAPQAVTDKPVLKPETGALLSLYLDREAGTARVELDQKPQVTLNVDPEGFRVIESIGIQCWLGDRANMPKEGNNRQ